MKHKSRLTGIILSITLTAGLVSGCTISSSSKDQNTSDRNTAVTEATEIIEIKESEKEDEVLSTEQPDAPSTEAADASQTSGNDTGSQSSASTPVPSETDTSASSASATVSESDSADQTSEEQIITDDISDEEMYDEYKWNYIGTWEFASSQSGIFIYSDAHWAAIKSDGNWVSGSWDITNEGAVLSHNDQIIYTLTFSDTGLVDQNSNLLNSTDHISFLNDFSNYEFAGLWKYEDRDEYYYISGGHFFFYFVNGQMDESKSGYWTISNNNVQLFRFGEDNSSLIHFTNDVGGLIDPNGQLLSPSADEEALGL